MHKFFFAFAVLLASCNAHDKTHPHVLIDSKYGEIEIELYPEKAPKTVGAFLSYVKAGYYRNSSFYRVLFTEGATPDLNAGVIQGGISQTDPDKRAQLKGIEHESTKLSGLSHTDGTVSLARTTVGSGNTEFFICIGDQTNYDFGRNGNPDGQGYAAFGKVVKGMDVVRKIQQQSSTNERFDEKIEIRNISEY